MSAATQWTTIGWMVLCGACMGLAFDGYRVSSHRFHIPRWLLPALDIAFWAAATLGVFQVLRDNNEGEVRLYVFLGLGIGITGYFGLFSKHVIQLVNGIYKTLFHISAWIWKLFRLLLIVPVQWLIRMLAKVLDVVFLIVLALLVWIGRLLLAPLRPPGRLLWAWLLPVRRPIRRIADKGLAWGRRWADRLLAIWDLFRSR